MFKRGGFMNIAIVDDDEIFAGKLKHHVETFIGKMFSQYEVAIICQDFETNLYNKEYDILFLDIDLKEFNGIDIGKKLLQLENNPLIIFVSSRNDLVFTSLSVRPFYFVRKSNYKEDLTTLFILLKKYLKETMTFFTFEFYGRKTNLFLKDIYMIESKGHNIILKTKDGEYTYRSTMKNILDVLGTHLIVQIQKSYAVNLDYIKEIDKGIVYLKNGEEYTIGRKFKEVVMQKYKEHFLR